MLLIVRWNLFVFRLDGLGLIGIFCRCC